MTVYNLGDIVLIPFPFTDQSITKKRHAVVVSSEAYNHQRPERKPGWVNSSESPENLSLENKKFRVTLLHSGGRK